MEYLLSKEEQGLSMTKSIRSFLWERRGEAYFSENGRNEKIRGEVVRHASLSQGKYGSEERAHRIAH